MQTDPRSTPDPPVPEVSDGDPPRPDRRLPVAALLVGLLAVALVVAVQPSIVSGGAGSGQAVAIAVGAGLLLAGFVVVMFRAVKAPVLLAVLVGVPPLALAGLLGVTALVDDEADDGEAEQLATVLEEVEAEDAGAVAAPEVPDEPAVDEPVPAATPVRLSTGTFQGLDDHAATGTVSLVEQADGSHVVLFEDFEVERGPDYLVYLVPGDAVFDSGAGVEVAPLQGNVGDQQYEVPSDLVGTRPLTVLIWCRAFDVNIAGATVS